MKMSRQANSLVVLQLASAPDLGFVTSAVGELIKSSFYQCMTLSYSLFSSTLFLYFLHQSVSINKIADEGFKEDELCPACIEHSTPHPEQIGTITEGDEVCFELSTIFYTILVLQSYFIYFRCVRSSDMRFLLVALLPASQMTMAAIRLVLFFSLPIIVLLMLY